MIPRKPAHQLRLGDVVLVDVAGPYPVDLIAVEHGPLMTVIRWGPGQADWVRFTPRQSRSGARSQR